LRLEQLESREVPSATMFDGSTDPTVFSSTAAAQTTGTYSSQNQAYVAALYNDILGRAPDQPGLDGWTSMLDNGQLLRAQVALYMLTSPENRTNLINDLYVDILGRPADAPGLQNWLQAMNNGMSYNEVRANFYGSQEFFLNSGGTNNAFLSAFYQSQLGRPIDPSGQQYWGNQLAGGTSRALVALRIIQGNESNGNLVTGFYNNYLGRAPDQPGYNYWVQQLNSGRSPQFVAALILGSDEFYNNLSSQVV